MVGSHQALFLVAPLEQGEVNNPQADELVLVAQTETVAHLQTEGAKLYAGLVGLVAAHDEHQVAVVGPHCCLELLPHFGCVELVDAGLDGAVGACGRFTKSVSWSSCLRV